MWIPPFALLILLPLAAGPERPAAATLYGVWDGTLTTTQAGRCTMAGASTLTQEIRVIIRAGDDGKPEGGWTLLPAAMDRDDNLKVSLRRDGIRLEHAKMAACGDASPRKYSVKWEGAGPTETDGKRTLILSGTDEPCSQSGCRFGHTVTLEWKRPAP